MYSNYEVATMFSGGKFAEVEQFISDDILWNIYEQKMFIRGRSAVLKFCSSVAEYFSSVTTHFQAQGSISISDKVAIYGRAEFIRDQKIVNIVNSCDVYEFDAIGNIVTINSYCNSDRQGDD